MDTLKYELCWLKEQGKEYCYFGQGYEHCSFWKADQSTFQWWDGNKWLRSIEEFKSLCDSDTKIIFESSQIAQYSSNKLYNSREFSGNSFKPSHLIRYPSSKKRD